MKKITLCVLLILVAGVSVQCKKRLFDYRNNYTGKWTFVYTIHTIQDSRIPEEETESGEFSGEITYDKNDDRRDDIRIHFAPDWTERITLNKDNELIKCEKIGSFAKDDQVVFTFNSNSCLISDDLVTYTVTGRR
jgi:hypothetical protein